MRKLTGILFFACFFVCLQLKAQIVPDTLRIGLDSAEQMFLRQNYSLLAQKYNIDAQKAQIIQAKLYPNPNFSASYSLYNPTSKKFFPTGNGENGGEFSAQLSQLIILAGKRNKQIKIAEENAKLAEYQFYDLIRTLKYTLRSDFFNIYYLQHSATAYNDEISSLQQVVTAFNEQQGKGYISEKEVIRVKAQLYSLQNEFNDLVNQINDVQSELRLILQVKNSDIEPIIDTNAIVALDPSKYNLTTLVDSAYNNRTDLMIARSNSQVSKLNYNYQKALAVPDITLALAYDQQGSYVNNFNSIGAAIDLPFFNRNQGNIKSAKALIEMNNATQKSTEATVEENVYRSLQKAFANDKLFRNIDPKFMNDFSRLLHEVLINYQKRNLTLLDFLDFYDSYKQNILQANAVQYNRVNAFEELNFYTGTNFFNH